MTLEIFLFGVIIVSILVGLVTEAVKKIREDNGKKYRANLTAGLASIILSVGVSIAYVILTDTPMDANMIIYIVALVFISWLGAMIGFDKIKEAISQLKE